MVYLKIMKEDLVKKKRFDTFNRAYDCQAYSFLFSRRFKKLNPWLKANQALGLVIPLLVGGLIFTSDKYPDFYDLLVWFSSILSVFLLCLSAVILVFRTEEKCSLYSEMHNSFNLLSSEFMDLAKFPDDHASYNEKRYQSYCQRQSELGKEAYLFSSKENRRGMRYSLFMNQVECAGCQKIPKSYEKATKCDVCGNF